jgi:hypothetical protein
VFLRSAQAGALKRAARVAVVRPGPDGGGVLDNGAIEILGTLGLLPGAEGGARGTATRQEHREAARQRRRSAEGISGQGSQLV